jgi:uncharacterized protein (DUF302 family)
MAGHFGLQAMKERGARIGAKITITSSLSAGIEIALHAPGDMVYCRNKRFSWEPPRASGVIVRMSQVGKEREMTLTLRSGIVHLTTDRPVSEVLQHLLSLLQAKAITVFAVVDHSGEAAKVGIDMHDTKLVIFGNPQAGTPLMITSPDSALDLPLKILIAENADGTTRVSYIDPACLQGRYGWPMELVKNVRGIEQIAATIAG